MPQDNTSYIGQNTIPEWYAETTVSLDQQKKTNSLVDKLLDKCKSPAITVDLKWDNAPINELNMLKTIYDVTDEEIVDAVVEKFVSLEAIKEQMTSRVNELLNPKKVGEKKPVKNKES